jgi:hypothetical protein
MAALVRVVGIYARYGRLGMGRGACARPIRGRDGEWMGLWVVVWWFGSWDWDWEG